ncbi:MAG: ABC transporter permease [Candidatus Omnitrophica bacterium]|nr:ABC transporter permease [Candidatus Omnitrophota bacterium]
MIELKNISKTYLMGSVEVKALDGVSLKIAPGEFVAIMGPSGSGKSTLMHILGLLDRPDTGEYFFEKKDLTKLSDEELAVVRNGLFGFIFQQFHLLPRLSALENVELPLIYGGKRYLKEKAKEKISMVGLTERQNHRPNELSGGQQQRVAIARSLINDPPVILADEPTGNLDSKSKEEIISILKELNREGKTVIIVTHEKEIAEHARRIIHTRDGRIISDEAVGSLPQEGGGALHAVPETGFFSQKIRKTGGAEFMDYFREALFAMITHKMRSILSILGVLIGVAAVIAMLAVGEGAKISIGQQLASLGSNLLIVRPGSSRVHGVALEAGAVTRFTLQDIAAIRNEGEGIKRASAYVSGRGQLVYGNKNWNTQVEGTDVEYAPIRASEPTVGKFFTAEDVRQRAKVAVLGMTVVRELFGGRNPVGETIKINRINFQVIGVLPEKGSGGFRDQDDTVVIPVTTAMYRLLGKLYLDSIYIEAEDEASAETATGSIESIIARQHRLNEKDDDSFQIRNMADIKNALESTTRTMSLLLGSVAAISLLVGGIGIMNIMLVSVTERTREIGLRKAIGANNHDIMVQFLIEAVLMSFLGGVMGVALGAGISTVITHFAGWAVKVSMSSILLATTFSLAVGVVFGLWPARQASLLDPITALRYE